MGDDGKNTETILEPSDSFDQDAPDVSEDGTNPYNVETKTQKGFLSTRTRQVVAGLGVCAVAVGAYAMIDPPSSAGRIETSDVQEFQEPAKASGQSFGRLTDLGDDVERVASLDFGPIEAQLNSQRADLEARNALLQEQVLGLQASLGDLSDRAGDEPGLVADLTKSLEEMQAQQLKMAEQMKAEFDNQIASIKNENEKAEEKNRKLIASLSQETAQLQQELITSASRASQEKNAADEAIRLQAQKEATLADRRLKAAALMEERIKADAVIFDGGSSNSSTNGSSETGNGSEGRDALLRDFVTGSTETTAVETASLIASPSHTVLQGTLIQATLENAVDSSLPGNVTAIVNYPVWSFDQNQVLIPAGSRVFGSYNSDVSIGQGRILVAWSRLVTPEGQSVQLSAFGGDQLGRSGAVGKVDGRFGLRFGNAALISLLGAAPSIAASSLENDTTSELAEDMSEDFSDAVGSVAAQYIGLPPIITIQQGAAITIMVDRDLEFF